MEWQLNTNAPIYSQLIYNLKLAIVAGQYSPGDRMPSVRDMAMEAGVNPNTMQRALQELERDGLVFSQRTSGRFVTEEKSMIDDAKRSLAEEQIRSFLGSMSRLGYGKKEIIALLESGTEEAMTTNANI